MIEPIQILGGVHHWLLSALSFLVGLLVGHRLALGRDKRKELLALVSPMHEGIAEWLQQPYDARMPTAGQLDALVPYMTRRGHRRLMNRVAEYRRCREEQQRLDDSGALYYADEPAILAALLAVKGALPR